MQCFRIGHQWRRYRQKRFNMIWTQCLPLLRSKVFEFAIGKEWTGDTNVHSAQFKIVLWGSKLTKGISNSEGVFFHIGIRLVFLNKKGAAFIVHSRLARALRNKSGHAHAGAPGCFGNKLAI